MTLPESFNNYSLVNRLGQNLQLYAYHTQAYGREYVFVAALAQHASSLVAKNAEHFALQLRNLFNVDARRFELIELRGDMANPELFRWKFEWVGNTPLSARSEAICSHNQRVHCLAMLNIQSELQAASA
jgi:hypothetical protein